MTGRMRLARRASSDDRTRANAPSKSGIFFSERSAASWRRTTATTAGRGRSIVPSDWRTFSTAGTARNELWVFISSASPEAGDLSRVPFRNVRSHKPFIRPTGEGQHLVWCLRNGYTFAERDFGGEATSSFNVWPTGRWIVKTEPLSGWLATATEP